MREVRSDWRVLSHRMRSSRRSTRLCLKLLATLVLAACDGGGHPDEPINSRVPCQLGLLASVDGDVLQTFQLSSPRAPASIGIGAAAHLEVLDGRRFLAHGESVTKVFDLDRMAPVLDLPSEWNAASAPEQEEIYLTTYETGPFQFSEQLSIEESILHSAIRSLHVSETGDTTGVTLRTASIRRVDDRRYATTRFVKAIPYGASLEMLFFQEEEVVVISTDSLGVTVHLDRYDFRRSLWKLDQSTGASERLLYLPDPSREGVVAFTDVTPDGRHLVYEDNGKSVHVDLLARSHRILREGTVVGSGEGLRRPLLAPDGEFALGLTKSCPQEYRAEHIVTGEDWYIFRTSVCDQNTAVFSDDGRSIYFTDVRADSIGVWRVPRTNRIRGHSGAADIDQASLVARFTETLNIVEAPWKASLSHPLFVSPSAFVLLHTYQGRCI